MKVIEVVSDKINDELADAQEYAKLALELRDQYRSLADAYFMLSQEEMRHSMILHNEVAKLIEDYRKTNGEPPVTMQAVYDYLHKKSIEKAEKVKRYQAMYKE